MFYWLFIFVIVWAVTSMPVLLFSALTQTYLHPSSLTLNHTVHEGQGPSLSITSIPARLRVQFFSNQQNVLYYDLNLSSPSLWDTNLWNGSLLSSFPWASSSWAGSSNLQSEEKRREKRGQGSWVMGETSLLGFSVKKYHHDTFRESLTSGLFRLATPGMWFPWFPLR